MGLITQMGVGGMWIRRVNAIGLKQQATGFPNICTNGSGAHLLNMVIAIEADVWTNGCGETALGRAKSSEYVRRIKDSSACPGTTSLFHSTCFDFSPIPSFVP